MRKIDAQMRYYFHIDPDSLDDREWTRRVKELDWVRKEEAKANKVK
jgi:hypothetical protein